MPEETQQFDEQSERQARKEKLQRIKDAGVQPYPERFARTYSLADAKELPERTEVKVGGRIMTLRDMGKICFVHLQDASGKMQVVLQTLLGEDYEFFLKNFDLGDFVGVEGEIFKTKKGEISVLVKKYTFLSKALRPISTKHFGIKDKEIRYRQRYLDLITNPETKKRFDFRSDFIRALREFYWKQGFREVETPVLLHKATGAHAKPYKTHNNGLDIDVVLRISHELPLKELIVGGYEKIFEIGKAFRNEGIDPSHLPEHTHLEHYVAYWNYKDNIKFTEKMFKYLWKKLDLLETLKVKDKQGNERKVSFKFPWAKVNYVKMIKQDSGIDVAKYTDVAKLLADIKKKNIQIEGMDEMALPTLIDNLFKKVSRPKLVDPVFVIGYPKILQPLARSNDKDPRLVDQFQLVVNGWEIVKAYSELVDPKDQKERFDLQASMRDAGDDETMEGDDEFIRTLEYGSPPISGWGMGVDRFLAILTEQENLRDVVFFPLMRPKD